MRKKQEHKEPDKEIELDEEQRNYSIQPKENDLGGSLSGFLQLFRDLD